jgi:molybdopterin-guanine dinucleotide biosynthesis protein A
VIGAILAGGRGRRIGGSKPAAKLAGRPLIAYPAAALGEVCERVVVVCKPDTELPSLPGVERWDEPAEPRHPVAGIVYALERAGEPVLVCAADMPFVTAAVLRQVAEALGPDAVAAVAIADGRLQPVLGAYSPESLRGLRAGAPDAPLTRTVESLDPVPVELPAALVRSVDTDDDLARAERELRA